MPCKRKKKKSPINNVNPKKTARKTMDNNGGKSNKEKNVNKGSNSQSGQYTHTGQNIDNQASQPLQSNQTFTNPQQSQFNGSQFNNGNGSNCNGSYNSTYTAANTPFMMMLNPSPTMMTQNFPSQHQQLQQQQQFQQCSTPLATSSPPPDMFSVIIQRLDSLDSKLGQLEHIQNSIKGINTRMDRLDQKVKNIEGKVRDLEESRNFDTNTFTELSKKQDEMNSLLAKMKQFETDQKEKEQKTQDQLIDLKCRSMRDNLVFYQLPEERGENCEEKILIFIERELKIEGACTEIRLHRAHRLGAYRHGYTRPIVAKFAFYPDRERVRKSSKNLKGTQYGISEQFPKEIISQGNNREKEKVNTSNETRS